MAVLSRRARAALGASALLSALVFGWAALALPVRPLGVVSGLGWLLCAAYGATAWSAFFWPERALDVWRASARVALAGAALLTAALVWTAADVVSLYGPLGWGVSGLLAPIGVLVWGVTVPFGIWGVRRTRSARAQP